MTQEPKKDLTIERLDEIIACIDSGGTIDIHNVEIGQTFRMARRRVAAEARRDEDTKLILAIEARAEKAEARIQELLNNPWSEDRRRAERVSLAGKAMEGLLASGKESKKPFDVACQEWADRLLAQLDRTEVKTDGK